MRLRGYDRCERRSGRFDGTKAPTVPPHPQPRVTVVIPTYNEAKNLPHVLTRLPADLHEVVHRFVAPGESPGEIDDEVDEIRQAIDEESGSSYRELFSKPMRPALLGAPA